MAVLTNPMDRRTAWVLLVLYCGLASALLRYHGLQHDAQAYVLQALATLEPTTFAGDLFLKFGSQDSYTLFSNFTALWISAFGIDHGAAALTAFSLLLFYIAAWLLVRTLVSAAAAWLAVGLLIVIPGWYGSGGVFHVAERFLSARLPAEALSLLAIAAITVRRYVVAALLFALAAITHPLMTVPAVCIGAAAQLTARHPLLDCRAMGVGLLVTVLLVGIALGGRDPWMSGDWLAATRARSDFLFLDLWRLADWRYPLIVLATLVLASRVLPAEPSRRIVRATLLVAVVGLAAAAVVSWGPSIKWVIQAQTWRWTWPATVLSIGLLPATVLYLTRGIDGGACSAYLLIAAWVLGTADRSSDSLHVVAIVVATTAAFVPSIWPHVASASRVLWTRAAALVATLSVVWVFSLLATEVQFGLDLGGDPRWMQRAIGVLSIPAIGAAVVGVAWFTVRGPRGRRLAPAVALVGAVLLMGAVPRAWESWTTQRFGALTQQRFAPWREMIGPDSEVFWPDQLQTTWFALGRRSYLSKSQLGGIVFSADTTAEARRRAQSLAAIFPPGQWFNETAGRDRSRWAKSVNDIRAVCMVPEIDFVVTNAEFGTGLWSVEWPMPGQHAYLYNCHELRRGSQ